MAKAAATEKAKATVAAKKAAEAAAIKNVPGTPMPGTGLVPTPVAIPEMLSLDDLAGLAPPVAPSTEGSSVLDGKFRVRTAQERKLDEVRQIVGEIAKRQREALKLYEALVMQIDFHKSRVKTRLARGSNRAGKTLMCAVEVARACQGQDPFGKYPRRGTAYVVGYDWSHHGTVTYPKLFQPGAFRCIEDEATGELRAYRPWDGRDVMRKSEVVDAEPLIPERYVADVSWYRKKESIPAFVKLTTGWEIHFFSGDGRPPRGQTVDLAWMDEEIGNQFWYNELVSRTADRDGKIIWSASPQSGTEQLYQLHLLAARQRDDPERTVEEFHIRLTDNPHLTAKQKAEMVAAKTSEAARTTDIDGEFLFTTQLVYGEYSLGVHGLVMNVIPDDWTLYAVTDPGHAICAVLYAAVPPPDQQHEFGRLVLFDESYIPKCSAAVYAERMRGKTAGRRFWDFIIDTRAGRQTSNQTGKTTAQQYSEALQTSAVRCELRGSAFCWGSDDVVGGIESVRGYLRVSGDGRPGLRVACERSPTGYLISKLPNFEAEIASYRMKRAGDIVTDRPEDKGWHHLMDAMRYLCAYQPKWHEQPPMEKPASAVYREFQKKQKQNALMQGGTQVGIRLGVGRRE